MTCADGLVLPLAFLTFCNHKEHLGGILLVPRKEKCNSHIDGECGKYPRSAFGFMSLWV